MATKDYDDYIDWTYEHGYDPADYETFEEYLDAVIKEVPPKNYHDPTAWPSSSQTKLDNQLINYFQRTVQFEKAVEKAPKGAIIDDSPAVKRKKRVRAKDQSGFAVRILKRRYKREPGKQTIQVEKKRITNTQSKQIISMEKKRVTDAKFTKGERKLLNKAIFLRANELRIRFDYGKSESLKRAHVEFK